MKVVRTLSGAVLLSYAMAAAGVPGSLPLNDYRHTAWTANDGAPAQISSMAQTPDGWLWFGTADGLYRFDGVAFDDVPLPPRGMLSRAQIYSLHAAANGDLWIGYAYGGLSVRRASGRVDDIPERPGRPVGAIDTMALDRHGSLWAMSKNGLFQLVGGPGHTAWRGVVDGATWSLDDAHSLRVDATGDLWAAFDDRIWRQDRASGRFMPAAPAGTQGPLMQSPDGRMWAQRGAQRVQIGTPAAPDSTPVATVNWSESRWGGQFDRDGNLWYRHGANGFCRLPADATGGAALDLEAGACIAGADIEQLLEDREGNLWIATRQGLDRYQPNRVLHSGLAGSGTGFSLAADADGAVWAAHADDGALWRLMPGAAPQLQAGRYVRVVGTARDGALLLAGKRTIERRLHGAVTQIALPPGANGKPVDLHLLGMLDDGRVLWIAAPETGLMGLVDGVWQPRRFFNLPDKIVISAAGAPGQLWLADGDGALNLYDNGKLTRYDAVAAGLASAVIGGPDVLVAGERGLAVLKDGKVRLLKADAPEALRNISGMAVTPDGDRWFNGSRGIVHVRAADWRHAIDHAAPLQYALLDGRDGYPGRATTLNRLPSAVPGGGGQLWFAATGGVVRLAPATLRKNDVAPTVQIARVRTPHAAYAPTSGAAALVLPPASPDFSIAYTAPALRRPEHVRFDYWLEGVDHGWVDGGTRRIASYSNVAPGRYRFHVRATNEDGVAGTGEAVQAIELPPTIVQSAWFKALCIALAVALGVAIYRYRIRVLTARLVEQMQVRASERERIARTLHDTYLQSVQALLLRVGTMAQSLPGGSPLRARLDAVLADTGHAVVEGRNQVEMLRAGSPAALAYALEDTIENVLARSAGPLRQCYPDVAYSLQVTGTRRQLAPAVLNEAGQIAAEALRNAFIHAGACAITVTVDYGAQFRVDVRDNGKGLDDDVRQAGYRSGHWGLLGMRERARDIGADLSIETATGAGTAIILIVPGPLAYAPAGGRLPWLARWLGRWTGY